MNIRSIEQFNQEKNGLQLTVVSSDEKPATIVVQLEGSLDTFNSMTFSNALFDAFNDFPAGTKNLILDMSGLHYISSTGIGSLTNLLVYCKKNAITVYLMALVDKVRSVLKMLGFIPFFNIIESVGEIAD